MTNDERAARLAAIAERAAGATPGPWRWKGNKDSNSIYLMRARAWGDAVMAFYRWGMRNAQPRFVEDGLIVKPKWQMGPEHHPWEIVGIDHPDARFIEHSRDDIDFLLGEVGTLRAALAALVADDFDAWTSSIYQSHWQCTYCDAHGADICDEPRVGDHKADCPWLLARALVGHTVPTEEGDDGE